MPIEIAAGDQPLEIDDYVVIEEVGRGAMKIVFRATKWRTGNDVALGILRHRYPDAEQKARFKREAELMQRLKHPNIVSIEKSGEFEGQPFIAMDYVGGGTIADQLRSGPANVKQIESWLIPICRAIQFAHDAGAIHRDLKPENILLTDEGVPKIADFGLARDTSQDQPLTRVGQALGTLHYVSPEQLCGDQVTTASDIYSLGVTLFEMLVGRKEFLQITQSNQTGRLAVEIERRRSETRNATLKTLFDVCITCTMTDPAMRFKSAKLLSDAIRSAVNVVDPATEADSVLEGGYVVGNKYTLEIPLDQGAMGEVWRASALDHAHKVVVKFMSIAHRHNQRELDRFRLSFELVSAITHQNICPLYAMGTDPRAGIYVVMKFHEGITLAQHCLRKRTHGKFFTIHEVCNILYPVAHALDHSHKRRRLHRDVKPANIIVSEENEEVVPVLIDFGLAEIIHATHNAESNPQPPSGTYRYIAPEVWAGQTLQAPSDQYSLGIVAYEMLSGAPPFSNVPDMHLPYCVQHNPVPALQGVSEKANEVLRKVLNKEPKERFGSCCDFIAELWKSESGTAPFVVPGSVMQPSKSQAANSEKVDTQQTASVTNQRKGRRFAVVIVLLVATLVGVTALKLPFVLAFLGWPVPPPGPSVNVDAVLKRGFELLESEQYALAKEAAETVIKLDSTKDSAYVLRGVVFLHEKLLDNANADFQNAIAINPMSALAYVGKARIHLLRDESDEAVVDCTRAIKIDPTIAEAFYYKGCAERLLGRLGDAVISQTSAIALRSDWDKPYAERGVAFLEQESHVESMADFERALALNPRNYLARTMRGFVFHCQQRYPEAILDFTKAIELNPANEYAYHWKGAAEFEMGKSYLPGLSLRGNSKVQSELEFEKLTNALRSLTTAIELKAKGSELPMLGQGDPSYVIRGRVFALLGRATEAVQDFEKAIEINPLNPEAHLYLANLFQQQALYEESIAEYSESIAIDAKSAAALYGKGVAELKMGLTGDALESLTAAIEIDQTRSDAFFKRGTVYRDRKLYEKAIADFKSALALDHGNVAIESLITTCEKELLMGSSKK